jgi:hypothetical protein
MKLLFDVETNKLHSWRQPTAMSANIEAGLSAIFNRNIFPEYETLVWRRNKQIALLTPTHSNGRHIKSG